MDKLYTMMYDLDRTGVIETISPLSILSTHKTLTGSLRLQLPDSKLIILKADTGNVDLEILTILQSNGLNYDNLNSALSALNLLTEEGDSEIFETNNLKYLNIINQCLLKILEIYNNNNTLTSSNDSLIKLFNSHNSYKPTIGGLKNVVVNTIYSCSNDVRNLEHSSQPMSSEEFKAILKEVESESGKKLKIYNNINPFTKFAIQYENSVGKKNVGIAANGIKAASSLQQYFNEYFLNWDSTTFIDENYKFDIDVNITWRGRKILKKHFIKLGDVVLSEEQFKSLYRQNPEAYRDLLQDSDIVNLSRYLQNGNRWDEEDYWVDDNGNKKLKSQYIRLELVWKAYLKHKPDSDLSTEDDLLSFLYYNELFNANVADNLSIMISLATDNAKELVLSRINANSQLMGLPLAMLTLGMDPKYVLDICVNVLDPIAKAMEGNPILWETSTNVRELLMNSEFYDEGDTQTRDSMVRIYDFAQELRILTSFFKVNLGVTSDFVSLLEFIKNLEKSKVDMEKRKGKISQDPTLLGILQLDKILNPENLDITYLNNLKSYINTIKTGINIVDTVLDNHNFKAMLEALFREYNTIRHVAGIARFVDTSILSERGVLGLQIKQLLIRQMLSVYLHFITGKALQKMTDLKFTNESIKLSLNLFKTGLESGDNAIGDSVPFGLDSEYGIENFIYIIENHIIPRMQSRYNGNFFVDSLVEDMDSRLGKTIYKIQYNVFNEEDVSELLNVLNALIAFGEISNLPSGLKTITGSELSIGDIMYLYNLITTKNRMSAMTKIVTGVVNDSNSKLPKILEDTYIEYDRKSMNIDQETLNEFNSTNLILQAVLSGTMTASSAKTKQDINLRGKYIWTLTTPSQSKSLATLQLELGVTFTQLPTPQNSRFVIFDITSNDFPYTIHYKYSSSNISDNLDLQRVILSSDNIIKLTDIINSHKHFYIDLKGSGGTLCEDNDFSIMASTEFGDEINNMRLGISIYKMLNYNNLTLKSDRRGYIIKLNGNTQIVISDEVLKDEEFGQLELLDLLIESKIEDITQENKIRYLDSIIKDSPFKQGLILSYMDYLVNHYPSLNFITYASNFYEINRHITDNFRIYYRNIIADEQLPRSNSLEDLLKNCNDKLIPGDIVKIGFSGIVNSDNPYYIYSGIYNNEAVFVSPDGSSIKRLKLGDLVVLFARSKVKSGYNATVPKNLKYGNDYIDLINYTELRSGDKIKLGQNVLTVADIIYSIDQNGEYIPEIVAFDRFGLLNHITDLSEIKLYKPYIRKTLVGELAISSIVDINPKFDNSYFINNLIDGDIVILNIDGINTQVKFTQRVNSNQFRDDSGKIYNISDIIQIRSLRDFNNNPDFKFESLPILLSSELSLDFFKRYQFRTGKSITKSAEHAKSSYVYQRIINYSDKPNVPVFDYNISDYYKVNLSTISLGDVFIKRNVKTGNGYGNKVYKIVLISSDGELYMLYSTTQDIEKSGQDWRVISRNDLLVQVLTRAQLDSELGTSEHYTKTLLTATPSSASNAELTSALKSHFLLKFIKDKLKMDFEVSDSLPPGTNAMVRNNKILVSSKFRDNELKIIDESIHEITHLILANLRLQDPDAYISLLNHLDNYLTNNIPLGLKQIFISIDNNPAYSNRIEKAEEKIVKFIDWWRNNKVYSTVDNFQTEEEMISIMNNAFNAFFGLEDSGFVITQKSPSMDWVIRKYNGKVFSTMISNLNIYNIKRNEKMKQILNKIKEYCY